MRTRLTLGLALALVVLAPDVDAADDPPKTTQSQVLVGAGAGVTGTALSIDGRRAVAQGGGSFHSSAEAGYTRYFGPHWGVGALLRFGNWLDDWSSASGESRQRLELRFAPEFRSRHESPVITEVSLSLGGGPSLAFFQPAEHRALREEYGLGAGFHAGPRAAAAFLFQGGLGMYLAADVAYYVVWVRQHAEIASAGLRATSHYRYDGIELMAHGGLSYSF